MRILIRINIRILHVVTSAHPHYTPGRRYVPRPDRFLGLTVITDLTLTVKIRNTWVCVVRNPGLFVPRSEKSTDRPFAPVELSFRGTFAPWNFRSGGTFVPRERTFQELPFRGTFAPVELSFLGSERSKNFSFYETVVPWERIFQELSLRNVLKHDLKLAISLQ